MSYSLGADALQTAPAKWSWTVDLPTERAGEGIEAIIAVAKEEAPASVQDKANAAIVTLLKGAIVAGFLVTASFLGYKYMTRQS